MDDQQLNISYIANEFSEPEGATIYDKDIALSGCYLAFLVGSSSVCIWELLWSTFIISRRVLVY